MSGFADPGGSHLGSQHRYRAFGLLWMGSSANSQPGGAERDDRTAPQNILDDVHVVDQQLSVSRGWSIGNVTQQDDGWRSGSPGGQQHGKVGIGCDHDRFIPRSPVEDLIVGRNEEAVIADMGGVVARGDKSLKDPWRQVASSRYFTRSARGGNLVRSPWQLRRPTLLRCRRPRGRGSRPGPAP